MSQEYNGSSRKSRRTGRSARNHPVLVTATVNEQSEQSVQDSRGEVATQTIEPIQITSTPKETRTRRFPSFFSTVGKSEQDNESKDADVAQARLTRAIHGKATIPTRKTVAKETPKAETKTERTTTTPARPPSAFKTRYIIGMALYLLTAQFIGGFEKQFIVSIGAERTLTPPFNIFGASIVIQTSTLVFLATLVIILVLLARLDLIPRSLGAMSGAPARGSGQTQARTSQDTLEGSRQIPLPMKQGVKGADDKLYQEYRTNQRREKKR